VVENNEVVDCWGFGIRAGMNNMEVKNNRVIGTVSSTAALGIGFDIRNSTSTSSVEGVIVQGNLSWKNQSDGFAFGVGSSSQTVSNCIVQNNVALSNGRHGIHGLETSHFNVIAHNTARNNGTASAGTYDGIVFQGDNNRIEFNTADDTGPAFQRFGIEVPSQADSTILRGNFCAGNTTTQYSITGTNTEWHDPFLREVTVADANKTIVLGEFHSVRYSTLTAARTVTLPAAIAVGIEVRVHDGSGNCSGANTITITRAGADVFDDGGGATTFVLSTAYAAAHVRCVAQGKWKLI
jgi:parallel beta-helix repeat protein